MQRRVFIVLLGAAGLATVLPKKCVTRTAVLFRADGSHIHRSFHAGDIDAVQDKALVWLQSVYSNPRDRVEIHNDYGPGGLYA